MKRGFAATAVLAALAGSWALIASDSHAGGPDHSQKTSICSHGPLRTPRADCAPAALPSTGNP
ncbi:MAG: hypothetical protein WBM46_11665, partial [Polyangiales bacterium]